MRAKWRGFVRLFLMEKALINTPLKALGAVEEAAIRNQIKAVEEITKSLTQHEFDIVDHFSHGVYAREMKMPKGSIVVGKIHRFKNLNIISQGAVSFFSIDGLMKVKAPFTFVGSPGAKRVIYAHEDTVWTVIHGTEETDIDKIEEMFIAKDYDELDETLIKEAKKCLGL